MKEICGAIFLFAIIMINGCSYVMHGNAVPSFTSFTETKYPSKSEKDEILIYSSSKPNRPYKELGIIKVVKNMGLAGLVGVGSSSTSVSDEKEMLKKAREIGADAVMDIKQGSYGVETGTAIVFTDK